ncbi:putative retrotransposon hot spot (RHS) protein [Trypanosoma cruzi]|nr:putative retrotransposon hot spot (RHS) protein [Trypanosoma cruzi]
MKLTVLSACLSPSFFLNSMTAEDLDKVLCAVPFFLVMAAAVGLCGCVFVSIVASSAVAPSLCWWGRRRATALVERRRWRGKAPTAADGDGLCCRRSDEMTSPVSHPTDMDEDRTFSLSLPSVPSLLLTEELQGSVVITNRMSMSQQAAQSMWTLVPRV